MRHLHQQLSWLVLGEDDDSHKHELFSLKEYRTYLIDIPELQGQHLCGSSFGWLFTMDILLYFRLLNPFTRKCYDLPPVPPPNSLHYITRGILVAKAILDRDPSHGSDFKVLVMYGEKNKLAFWKLGDPNWTLIQDACIWINDIIFFKEDFYAVGTCNSYDEIYLVNTRSSPFAKRVGPLLKDHGSFTYLVGYMEELLIVQRYRKALYNEEYYMTRKIIIFKVDLEQGNFSEYKPMEGHSVFMGANSCITIDPGKYHGCMKNALYLTDLPQQVSARHGSKDLCIYDMVESYFSWYYRTDHYLPSSPIWLDPNRW